MTEKELESIGVIPLFKSDSLFYISLLQIKFFDSTGEMAWNFKDFVEDYSDENMNEWWFNEYYCLMNKIII